MTLYFVQLVLGKNKYKFQVSSADCTYVDDFRSAIKNNNQHLLNSYDAAQLKLLQPDGTTEIDPGEVIEKLQEFAVGPKHPLVYLDAVANEVFVNYNFKTVYWKPTMGDLLAAKDGQEGAAWDYRMNFGQKRIAIPLPSLFTKEEWDILQSLNTDTTKRIHDAKLPQTSARKPFVIVPHSKYSKPYADSLQRIAATAGVVFAEDDLVTASSNLVFIEVLRYTNTKNEPGTEGS
eukprot:jgi/Hompol1/4162/HPOL_006953-RA